MMETNLVKNYKKFKRENPKVYTKFKRYAKKMYTNGRRRYSADAIVHYIRLESDLNSTTNKIKISNNHVAYLARDLIKEDKRFKTFFTLKPVRK